MDPPSLSITVLRLSPFLSLSLTHLPLVLKTVKKRRAFSCCVCVVWCGAVCRCTVDVRARQFGDGGSLRAKHALLLQRWQRSGTVPTSQRGATRCLFCFGNLRPPPRSTYPPTLSTPHVGRIESSKSLQVCVCVCVCVCVVYVCLVCAYMWCFTSVYVV